MPATAAFPVRSRYSYRKLYFALGILFVLAAAYQLRVTVQLFRTLFLPDQTVGSVVGMGSGDEIFSVSSAARAAGIMPGDHLVAVNGHAYIGEKVLATELRHSRVGVPFTLTTARDGQPPVDHTFALPSEERLPAFSVVTVLLLRFATPVLCLMLGFFVAAQRPFDPLAWLLLALMISFSQAAAGVGLVRFARGWEDGIRPAAVLLHELWSSSWPVWMVLFGSYFPERSRLDRRLPWIKWAIITPVFFWMILTSITTVINVESWRAAQSMSVLQLRVAPWVLAIYCPAFAWFYMQIGNKSGTLTSCDARRRLTLILAGSMVSLTPIFVVSLLASIRGGFDALPEWLTLPALLLLFLFPATLAYVIVVQRAMDVRMAVRQGMQYTLARRGADLLRMGIGVAIIAYIVRESYDARASRGRQILVIVLGTAAIFLLRRAGTNLSGWLDRRFFREAYNAEQILADLGDQVRTMVETQPLLEIVALRISDSLHVPRIALLLATDGAYRPAHSLGFPVMPPVAFPDQSATVSQIRHETKPIAVYLNDPDSWTRTLPAREAEMLSELNTELVLPLAVKDRLHGFIALSGKQSEQPYSRSDLRLLQSVATQTGLALENSQLAAAIASEIAHREILNRELEIAREVQQRLFPQSYPPVAGLEYAGACRPAQGVGGDYYDFIEVPGNQFGIAIGDISGKGIPAALLMASLQASLRSQTISGPTDLAGLMTNMNRLIYDASPSNRYATFFYAQFDPASRELTYVNGGHNPPMLLRGKEALRLDAGGPVVGLFRGGVYTQASIRLEPDDLLIAFTDGISEAMNAADDEFGEDRMLAVAEACRELSSTEIISRLISAADAFAAGAPQHDDMTLVVVKVAN